MCGLAGIFTPQSVQPPKADMAHMLAVMAHRGPDGTGFHRSADDRYQCGFARLAIIDLEGGDQPIIDPIDGRVLLGNGEIYNYLELRDGFPGRKWRTKGDMEVVLPLSLRYGNDFVDHLNGMYGLALYDAAAHCLTLVRDRLGIKQLYWAKSPSGAIVFASEIKALFASGLISAQPDEIAVASYLAHGWVAAPHTLWRNVHKIPPGHRLTIDADGEIKTSCYWRPGPAADAPAFTNPQDAARRLTDLLDDAVRLQLRSDVPLGALLSGGLDSGLLTALAARRLDRPLNTYTVRFEGAGIDESPLADLVARRYGARHTVFDLSMTDIADYLPRLAWYCDEPLADASLLPNYLIEQLLGAEVRVALNGTGGDELFAGYGRYFQLPVERRYLKLPGGLRRSLIQPLAGAVDPMTAWRLARAEKFGADRGAYLHDHCTLFPPPIKALIGCRLPAVEPVQRFFFDSYDGPPDTAALAAEIGSYLPEDLLLLLDRSSMASSVEGRVPFLDHRLVEAALAVPPAVRAPGGKQKALERLMAEPFLPAQVLDAPKQGFASPVPTWMRQGLAAAARQVLTHPQALARNWWSAAGIERLLADPQRHGHRLYALLMLELTIRIHAEGMDPNSGLQAFAA